MDRRTEEYYRDFVRVSGWLIWWDKVKYAIKLFLLTVAATLVIMFYHFTNICTTCGEEDE